MIFGQTVTTRFEEVKLSAMRSGKCLACGKRRSRSFSYMNTINPFNKNEDGAVRSYHEVNERVSKKLKDFMDKFDKRGFKCASCEDSLYGP